MPALHESISFLRRFLTDPRRVGAVVPSSRFLARALVQPLARRTKPSNILELGPGTGAVTKQIIPLIGPDDRFDLCEADPRFADHVRKYYLQSGRLSEQFRQGQVRLLDRKIQDVDSLLKYDFIISGLPLNSFELREVKTIWDILKRQANPDCIFSYFEYIGARRASSVMHAVRGRKRRRRLSAYLSRKISHHQFERQSVLFNLPPAHARHLRIGSTPAA